MCKKVLCDKLDSQLVQNSVFCNQSVYSLDFHRSEIYNLHSKAHYFVHNNLLLSTVQNHPHQVDTFVPILRHILILSFHMCIGFLSGLFIL